MLIYFFGVLDPLAKEETRPLPHYKVRTVPFAQGFDLLRAPFSLRILSDRENQIGFAAVVY